MFDRCKMPMMPSQWLSVVLNVRMYDKVYCSLIGKITDRHILNNYNNNSSSAAIIIRFSNIPVHIIHKAIGAATKNIDAV